MDSYVGQENAWWSRAFLVHTKSHSLFLPAFTFAAMAAEDMLKSFGEAAKPPSTPGPGEQTPAYGVPTRGEESASAAGGSGSGQGNVLNRPQEVEDRQKQDLRNSNSPESGRSNKGSESGSRERRRRKKSRAKKAKDKTSKSPSRHGSQSRRKSQERQQKEKEGKRGRSRERQRKRVATSSASRESSRTKSPGTVRKIPSPLTRRTPSKSPGRAARTQGSSYRPTLITSSLERGQGGDVEEPAGPESATKTRGRPKAEFQARRLTIPPAPGKGRN